MLYFTSNFQNIMEAGEKQWRELP